MATEGNYVSKCGKILVAAIDFGTTYSGYAFSFKSDYETDPTKVSTPSAWAAGTNALLSLKTPTTILLNKDGTFNSFGYDAEDQYSDIAAEGLADNYYFFRRFKMNLFNKSPNTGLKRNMEIEDDKGKSLPALTVFGMSIKFLKDHLLRTVRSRGSEITESDISWVLTVPAIWTDGSKQFMREAAAKAGIQGSSLTIALEPEAASLYCMHLSVDKMCGTGNQEPAKFSKGTKYMVVDVGGGTVDITVHEVVDETTLKELHSASGGAWGGTRVDAAFTKFLYDLAEEEVFHKFAESHRDDLLDLYREFETKKRNIKLDSSTKETVRIPVSLADKYKEMRSKEFKKAVAENSQFCDKVKCLSDKLRIDTAIVKKFFDESCNKTIEHVKNLLKHKSCDGLKIILLVGGFAESPLLQEAFRSEFSNMRVIIPEDAGLTVLKGAVLFGHNPMTVISRVAKYSYGIRVYRDFQEDHHPVNKRIFVGKKVKCKDIFARHVTKGQELKVGEPQSSQNYTPLDANQTTLVFDIFTSEDENPMYVTDIGCQYIGQLEVEMPDTPKGKKPSISVKMIFGGTELIVEASEESTGQSKKASFDFLS